MKVSTLTVATTAKRDGQFGIAMPVPASRPKCHMNPLTRQGGRVRMGWIFGVGKYMVFMIAIQVIVPDLTATQIAWLGAAGFFMAIATIYERLGNEK